MKKLTYILIIFTFILSFGITFSYLPLKVDAKDNLIEEDKIIKLNILTYNKDICDLVKVLIGDKHNIKYIVDDNLSVENIDLEKDLKENIINSNLFIYNGTENNNIIKEVNKLIDPSKTNLINISRGIRPVIDYDLENKKSLSYLLGINEYKIALYNIKIGIQEKDFENRRYYEERYKKIVSEIDNFVIKSKEELNNYDDYIIITNSNIFDYLFRDLDLKVKKVDEINSNEDLKEKNIVFIYNNYDTLQKIKEEYNLNCNYIELNYSNRYDSLINNINLIIDGIKNSVNS